MALAPEIVKVKLSSPLLIALAMILRLRHGKRSENDRKRRQQRKEKFVSQFFERELISEYEECFGEPLGVMVARLRKPSFRKQLKRECPDVYRALGLRG